MKSVVYDFILVIERSPAYLLIIYFVKQIKEILSKMFEKQGKSKHGKYLVKCLKKWGNLSKMLEKTSRKFLIKRL